MREFAEQEIVLPPDGPHGGSRFACSRNPWTALWLDACDSGVWNRLALLGVRQGGKTLMGSALPVMYHLFEMRETVIYAVPNLDMAMDKWSKDLLPVIKSSQYANLLPTSGAGSRGGEFISIQFEHGPTLRFMTGGGGDKSRAGFTARVVVNTESDGMDDAGGGSDETDKLSQIEGCTKAFGRMKRVYLECTASTVTGRIWREVKNGTNSRILIRCPHCRAYVTPEREHFMGWSGAGTVKQAERESHFVCPSCGVKWMEEDRQQANRECRLVHRGQALGADGNIVGPPPDTDTLGFRFTSANNLLVDSGVIGVDEWKASRKPDQDLAEKEMRQYVWALPHEPSAIDLTTVDAMSVASRCVPIDRGMVPDDATFITVAVDMGKRLCHWVAVAWRPKGTPHVVDYGRQEVASDDIGEERALILALRELRDSTLRVGWKTSNGMMLPTLTFYDRGWRPEVVEKFCEESGEKNHPAFGLGAGRFGGLAGERRATGTRVVASKDGYLIVVMPTSPLHQVEINADHWKSWVHARLHTKIGESGALTLFRAPQDQPNTHVSFAKHLVAEKKIEQFIPAKGVITRWEVVNRNNHWGDALAMACCAGSEAGASVVEQVPIEVPMTQPIAIETGSFNPFAYRGRY